MGSAPPAEHDGDVSHLPVLRDSRRRVLGGVCAGLARSWQVDPLLVRAAAVVAVVVTSGLGLFVYLALWVALPRDASPRRGPATPVRVLAALAFLAVVAGITVPQSRGATFGFAILGALAVLWFAAGRTGRAARPVPGVPPAGHPAAVAHLPAAAHQSAPQWQQPPSWGAPARPAPRPRRPWAVLFGVLAAWAALAVLGASGVAFAAVAFPAAALAVIGLALVLGAPRAGVRGRPRGLVAAGLAASLITLAMLLPAGGEPTPTYRAISSAADLEDPLELGVGTHTVDLAGLTLDADVTATITEEAGRLTVILPRGVNVRARYQMGMGQLRTPQRRVPGVDTDVTEAYTDAPGRPTLHLTIRNDVGDLEVRR